MSTETVGTRIRDLRRQSMLYQQELAIRAGLRSKSTISRYETGVREPSEKVLKGIARGLNTTVEWLRSGVGEARLEGITTPPRPIAKFRIRRQDRSKTQMSIYCTTAERVRRLAKEQKMPISDLMEQIVDYSLTHLEV